MLNIEMCELESNIRRIASSYFLILHIILIVNVDYGKNAKRRPMAE